ncbi:hypothetical protein [Protaetiibacter larvae]|uniref:DUF998 domain-containing protein n=1 Tax=Protaetiibacter larvae TaxID=2592654 RepID=A0A5C1Y7S2_9MICO|nr:hypothetical protein [Protaetiibacter larvae]QEO08957.1 hypothetical protein FLP23_02350 [Protaetiibacter larvae]
MTTPVRTVALVSRIGASATTESRATLVGAGALVLGFLAGLVAVAGRSLPIAGPGSLGIVTALVAAVLAAAAFVVGYLLPAPGAKRRTHPETSVWRLVVNIVALGIAHAAIALYLLIGMSIVLSDAFIGAEVYAFSSALIIGVASALAAYASFLSAAGMTTTRIATVLAVYLVVGVLASMLSSSDPHWWESNISALGIGGGWSGATFNITLIVAGALITAIAVYLAAELASGHLARAATDTDERKEQGRVRLLRGALLALGVFLALVGVFPVGWVEWVHNTFATGMVVIFAGLVVGIRWIVPGLPLTFTIAGYVFLAVILFATVLFFVGIYNLTAMEIVGFALIFTWLILLIRNISASGADARG